MRIGHGYDVHKFQAGDAITLGGVRLPFDKGLAAHSDGDVLIHAICDALLGAAAYRDIGRHFSDSDPSYKGIDSRILLRHVVQLLAGERWTIVNVDASVVAQKPKLAPYIPSMREHLAHDLGVSVGQVNVKATTTEGLGFAGREEGIAAYAVALIEQQAN